MLKLISFTSELHKSHDEYLNIDYDHKSILHIDNSLNTNDCGNARRPLVSKLLVCPNVLFLKSEYRLFFPGSVRNVGKRQYVTSVKNKQRVETTVHVIIMT
jgi:hypothetical protein